MFHKTVSESVKDGLKVDFSDLKRVIEEIQNIPTKTYLVVWTIETDGEIQIDKMTKSDIIELSKSDIVDFVIIDGELIKSFDSKFDIGRLR